MAETLSAERRAEIAARIGPIYHLLDDFADAQFACGEWSPDDDESFEALSHRARTVSDALMAAIDERIRNAERERDAAVAERAALARVLEAVPVHAHNAAVLASRVNLLEYTAGMEHGLGLTSRVDAYPADTREARNAADAVQAARADWPAIPVQYLDAREITAPARSAPRAEGVDS